jgi:hypothetical protein
MDDRLIGPRLKVRRANEHIEELDAARQDFIDTDPYVTFSENDPETGDLVYKVTVEPHAAEGLRDLSVIAGDAVHNLRSALEDRGASFSDRDRQGFQPRGELCTGRTLDRADARNILARASQAFTNPANRSMISVVVREISLRHLRAPFGSPEGGMP